MEGKVVEKTKLRGAMACICMDPHGSDGEGCEMSILLRSAMQHPYHCSQFILMTEPKCLEDPAFQDGRCTKSLVR